MLSAQTFLLAALQLALAGHSLSQTFDPTSVPQGTRDTWCNDQKAACPLICDQLPGVSGQPLANNCSSADLSFSCICSNGIAPNASQYSQTIPYFECTEVNSQCVLNCGTDSTCATNCQTNNPCGAQNPIRVNLSTVTTSTMSQTSAASTASDTNPADFTGFGGASTSSSAASGRGPVAFTIGVGEKCGLGLVFAGVFAGFAIFL